MCSGVFERNKKYSRTQWEQQITCSRTCGSRSHLERTPEQREKIKNGFTQEMRAKIAAGKTGEKNPNWKGGITPQNLLIRMTAEYRLWREAVFKRDDYTCQHCYSRGGTLNADHIKPFAYYPELRFAIDNGQTLCVDCHRNTPTWGARKPI